MKVTIEGTPEEIRAVFQTGTADELEEGFLEDLDTDRLAVELRWVKQNARKALRHICENSPSIGFDEVAAHMGVDTKVLSGMMSSVGRSAPSVARLFGRNYAKRQYIIEPERAKVLLAAFDKAETTGDGATP